MTPAAHYPMLRSADPRKSWTSDRGPKWMRVLLLA